MGDIAQILGVRDAKLPRAVQLQQLPPDVLEALGSGGDLPTSVPTVQWSLQKPTKAEPTTTSKSDINNNNTTSDTVVKVGNKWISSSKPARSWIWAPFASSARNDGLILQHWVRNHVEYPDYPYARFNIHLDAVTMPDANEYRTLLHDPDWSYSETEQLLDLARRFELRWPVIYDRWMEESGYAGGTTPVMRNIEDLQYRYYTVAAILLQQRIATEANAEAHALAARHAGGAEERTTTTMDSVLVETAAARALATTDPRHQPLLQHPGLGASNQVVFDLQAERQRRAQLQALWLRTKEEELEEAELRKELQQVDMQLRKLKKAGAHILAAARNSSSRAPTPIPAIGNAADHAAAAMEHAFGTTAPVAVPGTPYLQSGRLVPPAIGGGVNKSLLARMDDVLEELGVSKTPLPTKRVCDLYDAVRKDVLTLLIFQKEVLLKEGQLASKRLRWSKKTGQPVVMDEETLLGIHPPPTAATAGHAASASKAVRKVPKPEQKNNKKKSSPSTKPTGSAAVPSGGDTPREVVAAAKPPGTAVTAAKAPRKPSVPNAKRKRKAEEMGGTVPDAAVSKPAAVPSHGAVAAVPPTAAPAAVRVAGGKVDAVAPVAAATDPKMFVPGKKRPVKKAPT